MLVKCSVCICLVCYVECGVGCIVGGCVVGLEKILKLWWQLVVFLVGFVIFGVVGIWIGVVVCGVVVLGMVV